RDPEPVHHVVETSLEQSQEVLTGDALLALRRLEVPVELALDDAVDPLRLLLLAKLDAVRRQLAAIEPVLPGGIVAALDRALVGEASGPLQEELHTFGSAQTALGVAVSRHRRPLHPPPLRRAAAVVGDGGDVANGRDLEPDGLQRADGRLASGSGPAHEDLDLLQADFHALPRGLLGGRLRG